ncbi:type IX secretion system protein PorD [Chitinophaga rhizophila]|nr:DUF4835 family protein [Chitinophaga rhizophila]
MATNAFLWCAKYKSRYFVLLMSIMCIFAGITTVHAQELRANVTVTPGARLNNNTSRKVFTTLQNSIKEFLNGRRWTDEGFGAAERIECNFLLMVTEDLGNNTFRANLTIQSTRPVYNAGYLSSTLNMQDVNVAFRYVEFQPLEFSDNRVVGNDPLASNLTAILAYYTYIILGLDADSFAAKGGDEYFKKALNIVSNAPDAKEISGWKPFEGNRNRYWLQDNLLNVKFSRFHDVMYQYHRQGMDLMYEDVNKGRSTIMNCLNMLYAVYQDIPNSMLMSVFFSAKADELQKIFAKSPPQEKSRAAQLLAQMDVTNAAKYQQMK